MVKLIMFLFVLTASLNAQWEIQSPKFFGINFSSINFTDSSHGWIITSEGKLLKSTDSGDTWMPSFDDPVIKISSMFFTDNEYGWLIDSTNTLLLKTTNGGNTWSSSSGMFKKLHFVSRETGFTISQVTDTLAYILKTTDGGNSWDTIVSNRGFNNLYFYDENLGFAVNGHLFWRTEDGGNNWSIDTLDNFECPVFYDVSNIQFIDAETGFYTKRSSGEENDSVFCSAFTVLSATTDGGETWKNVDVIPNGSIVKFFNKLEGIFTVNNYNNGGQVYRTTNGGYNWQYTGQTAEMDRFTYPLDMNITDNGFVFISGTNGLLLRSQNFGVAWSSINAPSSLVRGYFFDENTGWAWTMFSVFKSTNGGVDWIDVGERFRMPVADIAFLNKNTGFAVIYEPGSISGNSYLIRSTDGGETWEDFCPVGRAGQISFIDDSTGFFVSGINLNRTTNGGASWELFRQGEPEKYIRNYYFFDKQLGFVITDNKILNRTSNGGLSWEEIPVGAQVIDDVFFINDSTGWLAGYNKIYKTTDGGLSWPVIYEYFADDFFRYIYFSDENNGWAASVEYGIIRTTDGGINWFFEEPVILLSDAQLAGYKNNVWAFGHSGLILKYNSNDTSSAVITSFEAFYDKNQVILKWTTSSEKDNKGFEIERMQASNNSSLWKNIGFVEGKGTTSEPQSYSFIDSEANGGEINYRLKNISTDGGYTHSAPIVVSDVTSAGDEKIPFEYNLGQNYPNPFNPTTTIEYALPSELFTTLKIYDITGREVAVLVNERKSAGRYSVSFNAGNYASGVYYYTIRAGDYFKSRKMILLK